MSEIKGLVLLVGDDDVRLQRAKADFQSAGRDCLAASDLQAVTALCTDPLNQPVVLFSENIALTGDAPSNQTHLLRPF